MWRGRIRTALWPLVAKMLDEAGTARGKPEEVSRSCIACLTGYYLWRDDPTAKAAIERIVEGMPATRTMPAESFPLSGTHCNTSSLRS